MSSNLQLSMSLTSDLGVLFESQDLLPGRLFPGDLLMLEFLWWLGECRVRPAVQLHRLSFNTPPPFYPFIFHGSWCFWGLSLCGILQGELVLILVCGSNSIFFHRYSSSFESPYSPEIVSFIKAGHLVLIVVGLLY